jgi:hypothetical protein
MTGINNSVVRQHHKFGTDAIQQLAVTAAEQIRPAYPVVKQGISAKHHPLSQRAYTSRAVTRRVKYHKMQISNVYAISII